MKPKEYVKKYKMDETEHFDHSAFVSDLTLDFVSTIDYQLSVGQWSLSHFENIVKQIKQKFDSISIKSKSKLETWEKLWKFFYASVVVKYKDEYFGEQLKKKKEEWEQKHRWERETWTDNSSFNFRDSLFFKILNDMFSGGGFGFNPFFEMNLKREVIVPVNAFVELGLNETASVEDVNTSFRKLSLKHHPDKGGNAEVFRKLVESKNKCLMYLQRS